MMPLEEHQMPRKRQMRTASEPAEWSGGESARAMGGEHTGRRGRRGRKRSATSADRGQGARGRQESRREPGFLGGVWNQAGNLGSRTAHLARDVAGGARDIAGGAARGTQETVVGMAGYVREHPWPSLLVGAGAAWMAADAVCGGDEEEAPRGPGRGRSRSDRHGIGSMVKRTASAMAGAGRGAGGHVGRFVRDNPLLVGAAALGVGLAVGTRLPSTGPENEMFGEARDRLVRRARDVARDTMENVKGAAESGQRLSRSKR
jgi:ElaB/YqjD/DUF883 family membrane-anchored ribosome-binding protein